MCECFCSLFVSLSFNSHLHLHLGFLHCLFAPHSHTFSHILCPSLSLSLSLSAARTRTRTVLLRPLTAFDRRTLRIAFQQWTDFHRLAHGFAAAQRVANQWRLHRAWEAWNGYVAGPATDEDYLPHLEQHNICL